MSHGVSLACTRCPGFALPGWAGYPLSQKTIVFTLERPPLQRRYMGSGNAGQVDGDCPEWDHVVQAHACCADSAAAAASTCAACQPTSWLALPPVKSGPLAGTPPGSCAAHRRPAPGHRLPASPVWTCVMLLK